MEIDEANSMPRMSLERSKKYKPCKNREKNGEEDVFKRRERAPYLSAECNTDKENQEKARRIEGVQNAVSVHFATKSGVPY